MKRIASVALIAVGFFACKPVKKVESIQNAITKRDTVQRVIVKESPKVDSATIVQDIMSKVVKNKINFTTFSAKIKVDYEGPENSQHITANVKMQKDSVIVIRLMGALGIIGMEAKITKDSVILINRQDKWVERRSISYLQDVTEIPFDFSTLQDMIIGNPVFINKNITAYKSTDQQLQVLMIGKLFKHFITLDNSDYKVLHSKLDDIDVQRNRTCDVTFGSYDNKSGMQFATYRKITVSEKSKLNVNLDFKQYSFNEPLNYSFTIPKNYKRK